VVAAVRASDRDLHALAAIVSEDRPDLPDGDGLPPSLLADLKDQIRCDVIALDCSNSGQQGYSMLQSIPAPSDDELKAFENLDPADWEHWSACRWECQCCTYPERTGDRRSVVKPSDFYSARQWHSTRMYCEILRPHGWCEHQLQLCLPDPAGLSAGPRRKVRLYLYRGPGLDFSERDRAVLTLLRPHLHQAYLDAERRRHPVPRLTARQKDLLHLLAAGHTNTQIARRLGISEGTVRTHLENIYERLHVSSRTAAVTRAFPDPAAQRLAQCGRACPGPPLPCLQGDLDTAASSGDDEVRGTRLRAAPVCAANEQVRSVRRRCGPACAGRPPKTEPSADAGPSAPQAPP
jgi:DNA-binding CsgD family transcriptional regulator